MENVTKFLLDSGDPNEHKEIAKVAKDNGSEIWGSTTNPTLIAKKLAGKKITQKEAFNLQKEIVLEITSIVSGAVSAEVYADQTTTAGQMIEQGRDIATWSPHVIVKLPTTIEGFKARTVLRKENIPTNNTLVFSQQQIFAICLHEQIMQKTFGPLQKMWPPFISPFAGRLDDIGEDGMSLVENGMKIKKEFMIPLPTGPLAIWMLEASVRSIQHMRRGIAAKTELITAPAKTYREWFSLPKQDREKPETAVDPSLKKPEYWIAPEPVKSISTVEEFTNAIETHTLDIRHLLTDKGIMRFADDWKAIISN